MRITRGVAQLGSARRSGRRGRRFKSGYPDKAKNTEYQHTKEAVSKAILRWPLFIYEYQNSNTNRQ